VSFLQQAGGENQLGGLLLLSTQQLSTVSHKLA